MSNIKEDNGENTLNKKIYRFHQMWAPKDPYGSSLFFSGFYDIVNEIHKESFKPVQGVLQSALEASVVKHKITPEKSYDTFMTNPALKPMDELNEFTEAVKEIFKDVYSNTFERHYVLLRNGDKVRPIYSIENGVFEFFYYRWNLDGTSITGRDFDMISLKSDYF